MLEMEDEYQIPLTAAKATFAKYTSHLGTLLLRFRQGLPTAFWVKSKLPHLAQRSPVARPLPDSPASPLPEAL